MCLRLPVSGGVFAPHHRFLFFFPLAGLFFVFCFCFLFSFHSVGSSYKLFFKLRYLSFNWKPRLSPQVNIRGCIQHFEGFGGFTLRTGHSFCFLLFFFFLFSFAKTTQNIYSTECNENTQYPLSKYKTLGLSVTKTIPFLYTTWVAYKQKKKYERGFYYWSMLVSFHRMQRICGYFSCK